MASASKRGKSRKEILEYALAFMNDFDPSGVSAREYKAQVDKLSDAEWNELVRQYRDEEDFVPFIAENFSPNRKSVDRMMKACVKHNVTIFSRCWVYDQATGVEYLTNRQYFTPYQILRRQIQTLDNKRSVPDDNRHIDERTHQPTGVSAALRYSYPEGLITTGQGHTETQYEVMHFRAGDLRGWRMAEKSMIETGQMSLKALEPFAGPVKANVTLRVMMFAQHLDNNF